MLKIEDIRAVIEEIFENAEKFKLAGVVISSGNLHRLVGGYPSQNHRMRMCCNAMRQYMKPEDIVLGEPKSGEGATLEILYKSPFTKRQDGD